MSALVLVGPRGAILVWWLLQQSRWELAFNSFFWPLIGFLVAPWTTLMYVVVFPGGVDGFDWVWMAFAIAGDLIAWASGGYTNRARFRTA